MLSDLPTEPITLPLVGLGLRHPHYDAALKAPTGVDFVEFHAENLYPEGGLHQAFLADVLATFPVSIHGTSLGLGSTEKLPDVELAKFAGVIERTQPLLVSEHICFNRARIHGKLLHSGDLYPIPYNNESLDTMCHAIVQVQSKIGRPILLENLSAYLPNIEHTLSESEFLHQLVQRTECGLLLDLNNILVNLHNQQARPSSNQSLIDQAIAWIKTLPLHAVQEIHLAGFSPNKVHGFYIDDHGQPVSDECWALYRHVIALTGPVPTLIEWDNDLPEWEVLIKQATLAKKVAREGLQMAHVSSAPASNQSLSSKPCL